MKLATILRRLVPVLALMVIATACSSSDDDGGGGGSPGFAAVEDCVADGTCSPGPALSPEPPTDTYQGLAVGFTAAGHPYIGDPEAPVTLVEFSDFLCPYCFRHTTQTAPALLLEYGSSGEVNFVFRDFPLAGLHPQAPAGHAAAGCVAEQGAALFWAYHDALFRDQQEWADLADASGYLATTAEEVGVDPAAYRECVESGRTAAAVDASVTEIQGFGFSGTPSFRLVDNRSGAGYDLVGAQPLEAFQASLDAVIAGEAPAGLTVAADATSQKPMAFSADPAVQDSYQGLPVGFTPEGHPYIGNPDAGVTVEEFSDFLCPFCFRHTTETAPALLDQYGADVQFVFRDFPLASLHPTAPSGHTAAVCVGEQGAAFYWAFHNSLFFNQQLWAGLSDPTPYLAETVAQIGADLDAYQGCMDSGRAAPVVAARVGEGEAAGFSGTPSFRFVANDTGDTYRLVGAQPLETFQTYLDALLAGDVPPEAVANEEQSAQLPLWASAAGLAPDPERPGYTVAADPYKGDPAAPVVVVEFSDLQCPACRSHAVEVQPALDEAFVETGDVMWVFKHFPLPVHRQAPAAAAAAECAGDQGAFFEMERRLFETQDEWSVEPPDARFYELATGLGLDPVAFGDCLAGRGSLERVLADLYDGTGLIASTPTFFILFGGQGRRLEGALDVSTFADVLQGQVDAARALAG